jgi:hypothetical protein
MLTPEENKPDVVPPFNAYSPPGDVKVNVLPYASKMKVVLFDTNPQFLQ